MNKNQLREKMLHLRTTQSIEQAKMKSAQICKKIIKCSYYKNAKSVMMYFPIKGEVLTDKIIKNALENDKILLAPKVMGDKMVPVIFNLSSPLRKGSFGVTEPLGEIYEGKIDLVIVPALAFDKSLNRIGFGKGYYDKFLKDKKCVKIGIGYDFQIVDKIPSSEHDVPMDILIHG